ncbi:MAG: hypothetical protein ABFC34_14520 [Methanobacterium sp.]
MKTQVYDRLPYWVSKDSEDSNSKSEFDGFKDIKLESREKVVESIKEFIKYSKDHAKGTTACTILGEWGQGKTEIFNSLIKPYVESQGDYAFFLSASTLANVYSIKELNQISKKTPLVALRLLTNLFEGIRVEARSKQKIPQLIEYADPEDYTEDVLKELLNPYEEDKKIFIFIDEFEELLINNESLKEIISGIKEIINGTYGKIDINGEYEGSVHLFISITPDARYKLEVHEDTSLIFGGLGRRLTEIELQEIRRYEGLNFLKSLLEYSYNNKLPTPYPIENLGLFNTLFKISQRNLGNIIKLYSNLFNSLSEGNQLEVLNYKNLLKFLEKSKIYVYGAQTAAIEKDPYYKSLKLLNEQKSSELGDLCVKLFKIFIGEFKPFTIQELSEITDKDENLILRAIRLINENIELKEKIKRPIIKLAPLKKGKTIDDVYESLNYYISTDEKINRDMIKIHNFAESIEDFEDRITFYDLDEKGNLTSQIFLPYDDKDTIIFFQDEITNDLSIEIHNSFNNLIENEKRYVASELILNSIYPSPVPRTIDYIKNKEERLKLWRDISRNLTEEYGKNMPHAFLKSLVNSDIYSLKNQKNGEGYSIVEVTSEDLDSTIKTMFYSVNGDVKAEDIEYIHNKLSEDMSIHLGVILFSGEFSQRAKDLASNKGLDEKGRNSILGIHIHPTLAKRLICSYKSLEFPDKIIDKNRRALDSRDIILRELEFSNKIKKWLKNQSEKGLVINQISTTNIRAFADSLKLYINYMEESNSPEDILNKNLDGILKFRKYGKKSGLITTDFEDSPIVVKNYSVELHENGFLSKNTDGTYTVKDHPVETRIFEIIKKEKKVTVDELKKYFIIREGYKKIFEDVFLNILEYKGKIQKKGKKPFVLVDKEEAYEALKMEYNKYKKTIEKESFRNLGHFYITKQRGDNLIIMDKFNDFLKNTFEEVNSLKYSSDSESFLRKIFVSSKLIDQFNNDFKTAIESASKQSDKIFEDIQRKKMNIEKDFDYIVTNSRHWLKLNLRNGKESIHEYIVFMKNYNEFIEIYNKKYTKIELEEITKNPDFDKGNFKFDKSLENAHYFNLKLFKLEEMKDILSENIKHIEKLIYKNKTQFNQINSMQSKLEQQLKTKNINPKYKISYYIYKGLISADLEKDDSDEISELNLKLSEIEKISKGKVDDITEKLQAALSLLSYLEESMKKEKNLIDSIERNKEKIEQIEKTLNIPELKEKAQNFKTKVLRIENEYRKMDPMELEDEDDDPTFFIEKWDEVLRISEREISKSWEEYKKNNIEFIKKVDNTLNLIKNKSNSLEGMNDVKKLNQNFKEKNLKTIYETKLSASEFELLKEEIRYKLKEIISKELKPNEHQLITNMQSIKTKSKWIDYTKIREFSQAEGMTNEEIERALEGLVSKGYLEKGFNLL